LARKPRLEQPYACAAAHAVDEERDLAEAVAGVDDQAFGSRRLARALDLVRGDLVARRGARAALVERGEPGGADRFRDRHAASAAEARVDTVDDGSPRRPRRVRIPAVKTVRRLARDGASRRDIVSHAGLVGYR
jgi:hypothetical protein